MQERPLEALAQRRCARGMDRKPPPALGWGATSFLYNSFIFDAALLLRSAPMMTARHAVRRLLPTRGLPGIFAPQQRRFDIRFLDGRRGGHFARLLRAGRLSR